MQVRREGNQDKHSTPYSSGSGKGLREDRSLSAIVPPSGVEIIAAPELMELIRLTCAHYIPGIPKIPSDSYWPPMQTSKKTLLHQNESSTCVVLLPAAHQAHPAQQVDLVGPS